MDWEEGKEVWNELHTIYKQMPVAAVKSKVTKDMVYVIHEYMDNVYVQHLDPTSEASVVFGNQVSHQWREVMREIPPGGHH